MIDYVDVLRDLRTALGYTQLMFYHWLCDNAAPGEARAARHPYQRVSRWENRYEPIPAWAVQSMYRGLSTLWVDDVSSIADAAERLASHRVWCGVAGFKHLQHALSMIEDSMDHVDPSVLRRMIAHAQELSDDYHRMVAIRPFGAVADWIPLPATTRVHPGPSLATRGGVGSRPPAGQSDDLPDVLQGIE